MRTKNKILDEIRTLEDKQSKQWLSDGLCYCCERYGQCDYNPCEAYKERQEKRINELRKRVEQIL